MLGYRHAQPAMAILKISELERIISKTWTSPHMVNMALHRKHMPSHDAWFELSASHNLEPPGMRVSMKDCLEHVGLWAGLWGIALNVSTD